MTYQNQRTGDTAEIRFDGEHYLIDINGRVAAIGSTLEEAEWYLTNLNFKAA